MTAARVVLVDAVRAVNIGLEVFAHELEVAGVPVLHVDWRPPNPRVAALLARLDDGDDARG